jgi:hypothetical protein
MAPVRSLAKGNKNGGCGLIPAVLSGIPAGRKQETRSKKQEAGLWLVEKQEARGKKEAYGS